MSTEDDPFGISTYENAGEKQARGGMLDLLRGSRIPDEQVLSNLGLFLDSKHLSRILFMDHLYRQIVDTQGVVMEFGTRWGQNLALFSALRGIYEPFNRHRKLIGFDTFDGFPEVTSEDGASDLMVQGNLKTGLNHVGFLNDVMATHEAVNPLAHIKKYDLRVGDATEELPKYLEERPETIIALAYFDFDLYAPTKRCLELIAPRITKGTVLGFDELNDPDSPGETVALMETIGLPNIRLRRYRYASRVSYFVVE